MLSELEMTAEHYYHGTSMQYLDEQLRKHGRYRHDDLDMGAAVCVAPERKASEWYARDKARNWYGTPVVMQIDGDKVRGRIYEHPVDHTPVIDSIGKDEFLAIQI